MTTAADYLLWRTKLVPNGMELDELVGVDDEWELSEGVSRVKGFPTDAKFKADPDMQHNIRLVDNLYNTDELIVVSDLLKVFLEDRQIVKVEYLPISIINHKGRVASKEYWIVHPIEPVNCLDLKASGATTSAMDPEQVSFVKKLVLDEDELDESRELFRPKHFSSVTLVHRELASAIDSQGFEGVRWLELDEFPE